MSGLPRSYIKKYGVSKRAWREYRKSKSRRTTPKRTTRKRKTKIRRTYKMARRKKSVKRRSGTAGILGKLNKPIVGALGVVAYESFISPRIPATGLTKNLIELLGGAYLSKKGGILGATGQTLVVLNAYQLVNGFAGGMMKGGNVGGNSF